VRQLIAPDGFLFLRGACLVLTRVSHHQIHHGQNLASLDARIPSFSVNNLSNAQFYQVNVIALSISRNEPAFSRSPAPGRRRSARTLCL
jgi:hypothetical protein